MNPWTLIIWMLLASIVVISLLIWESFLPVIWLICWVNDSL